MKLNERTLASFASEYTSADKTGYLLKKGEVNKGFQKRFFLLKGNMLFYFEKQQDKEPVGVIILENFHVELCCSEVSMFAFQIVFEGSGTRRYVLAADDHSDMESWMRGITHAGYNLMRATVEELEKRLEKLKKVESQMAPGNENLRGNEDVGEKELGSSESGGEETTELPCRPINRQKYKTLPPRRPNHKKDLTLSEDPALNRWSFSSTFPSKYSGQSSDLPELDPLADLEDLIKFSERTDFLHSDSFHSQRHFSINDFTPPSFSELKKHQEIEDQTLFDLDCGPVESKMPHGKLAFSNTLANRITGKSSRRAKSERHRKHGPISSPRNGIGSSLYGQRKTSKDDMSIADEQNDSQFQHLHRLWGASIWVKVREYELEQAKEMDSKL